MSSPRDELLVNLEQLPARVARLVEGKSRERLERAGPGGGWGAVENLAHLRDFDEVTLERVEQILSGLTPELELFDTDLRAIELDYHAQDPFAALRDFERLRRELVDRLAALPPEAWQRTARHPVLGAITLEELIRRLAEHGEQHFATLRDEVL
ncbi:MAG TPA: DinB family protein [Thermomicrobiaceae bacterium]|nr:DinB family protein [Thermomicrobiaceae bacterium]